MLESSLKVKTVRDLGKPVLTAALYHRDLKYDPETGNQIAVRAIGGRKVGDIVGSINSDGYTVVFVGYWQYRAHRLAYLTMTGEFPADGLVVDHINHVRTDNRWSNLRLLTQADNNRHRSPEHCSVTGERCVYPQPNGKFSVQIAHNGQTHRKGGFRCLDDAVSERCRMERHLFGKVLELSGGSSQ